MSMRTVTTVGDLIRDKDYDYISWRVTAPPQIEDEDIFFGCCASKNGELMSLDGDSYCKNEIVIRYEEWSKPEEEIYNGITVVTKVEWY